MADIIFLNETDSTNIYLKRLAHDRAREGTTVIAKSQSCGRGRLGKSFHSPDGGLYMSTLLRPKHSAAISLLITTAAAAAVSRAVFDVFGQENLIKWVNDIYINSRKVCGILAESALCGDKLDFVVLGIGVNLYQTNPLPDSIKSIAGFICEQPCSEEIFNLFANTILKYFYEYYGVLESKPFLEYYKAHQLLVGREITVIRGESIEPALALGIDDELRLRIKQNDKESLLSFGEVSISL